MESKVIRLSDTEAYPLLLVDRLMEKSMVTNKKAVLYMGRYNRVVEPDVNKKEYYVFSLENGTTVIASREGQVIETSARNITQLRNTKNLLSLLTGIPKDRFII